MKRIGANLGLMTALLAVTAGSAWGLSPADKCEADKNKVAGKYYFCRAKAEAKALTTASTPDYSKCTSKFDEKWDVAESKGGGMCPDTVLTAPMNAYIAAQAAETAAVIAGTQGTPACGDNTINAAGEACDGADLDGETCVSLGFAGGTLACSSCAFDLSGCSGCTAVSALPASGQTTSYGAGSDGDVQAGATLSYTDNGDGTITDNVTGLMWEKKSDDGTIHDKDNSYTWGMSSSPYTYTMNGTMVTTFLAALNGGGGFAGYTDWRIPNAKELQSIVSKENVGPAVSSVFNTGCVATCTVTACSCTQSYYYWSATTFAASPDGAWFVHFFDGSMFNFLKTFNGSTRAVRGGS